MSCTFCEFIKKKRKKHRVYGLPFILLAESQHTITFSSIDVPKTQDAHLLVVPKRHTERIEDLPNYILHDLIEQTVKASKILTDYHEASNILLNNGYAAGQREMHVHIHVLSRDEGDKFKHMEWPRQKISSKKFKQINSSIKKRF